MATWVVEFEGQLYGPFTDEDACYNFAAQVSVQPNDWTPIRVLAPALAEVFASAGP